MCWHPDAAWNRNVPCTSCQEAPQAVQFPARLGFCEEASANASPELCVCTGRSQPSCPRFGGRGRGARPWGWGTGPGSDREGGDCWEWAPPWSSELALATPAVAEQGVVLARDPRGRRSSAAGNSDCICLTQRAQPLQRNVLTLDFPSLFNQTHKPSTLLTGVFMHAPSSGYGFKQPCNV